MIRTKYAGFMSGYKAVVDPINDKIKRLIDTLEDDQSLDSETWGQMYRQLPILQRQRDVAIAEYAGIPFTERALSELHSATTGSRRSAYAYKVLDELPENYCAD